MHWASLRYGNRDHCSRVYPAHTRANASREMERVYKLKPQLRHLVSSDLYRVVQIGQTRALQMLTENQGITSYEWLEMEHYDDAVTLQAASNLLRTQILDISTLQKGHCGNLKW